jgi:hypothetical protein
VTFAALICITIRKEHRMNFHFHHNKWFSLNITLFFKGGQCLVRNSWANATTLVHSGNFGPQGHCAEIAVIVPYPYKDRGLHIVGEAWPVPLWVITREVIAVSHNMWYRWCARTEHHWDTCLGSASWCDIANNIFISPEARKLFERSMCSMNIPFSQ